MFTMLVFLAIRATERGGEGVNYARGSRSKASHEEMNFVLKLNQLKVTELCLKILRRFK